MLSAADISRFRRDGFLLLKGVFAPDEVARFREAGADVTKATDLAAVPGLESLWADARFLSVAKQLLGKPIIYFGEASYAHMTFTPGPRVGGRHLHHDAKGTAEHLFNRQHAPPAEPYPIIRFAIYLQDHASLSGGLKVVPGSHQTDSSTFDQARLTYFNVPSEAGDLVVFCNKILHSPYALRFASDPDKAISPLEEVKLAAETPDTFLPGPLDRRVIFIDYAGRSELADIYIKSRALNPHAVTSGLVAAAPSIAVLAERSGVGIRLDAAVIEAMSMLTRTAINGKITEAGKPYLAALPLLCRLSQDWTPRYNFVAPPPPDDSVQSAIAAYSYILPRVTGLRGLWKTKQNDLSMGTYDVAPPA
jgi:hypothetical protein